MTTTKPNVQIIAYRDPDSGTELSVFVDGKRLEWGEYEEVSIDPGWGYTRSEWNERIESAELLPDSEFKSEYVSALHSWGDSRYIEEDD